MDNGQQTISLVVFTNSYFTGLAPLAGRMRESGAIRPVFLFAEYYPTVDRDIQYCNEHDMEFYCSNRFEKERRRSTTRDSDKNKLTRVLRILLNVSKSFIRNNPFFEFVRLFSIAREFRRAFLHFQSRAVVLASDNRFSAAVIIKVARDMGLRTVIIPQFMAGPGEWAQNVYPDPAYAVKGFWNRIAAVFYPHWKLNFRGKNLLALTGFELLAREWYRVAPPLPWVLHSGFADLIAVESAAIRSYCLREGLPSSKIVITGSIAHDMIADSMSKASILRAALYRELGMKDGSRLLLSALPPDQLYGLGRPECEFQNYRDLVEFWIKTLTICDDFNVVICLHPSAKYEDMKYIEDWGVRISRWPTSSLVPLCDLYVASISATIQWAIACARPVVNYDVYKYRYPDYVGVEGVLYCDEREQFRGIVKHLMLDERVLEETRRVQDRVSKEWGLLDGKAGERLLSVIRGVNAI